MINKWIIAYMTFCCSCLSSLPHVVVFDFGGVMTRFAQDGNVDIEAGINEEMFDLVYALKQHRIPVALLSNVPLDQADFLDSIGYYDPFDPCILSCDVGMQKPDAQIYHYLLQVLDEPAEDVVFIDDMINNVKSAKEIGIDAILFESTSQIIVELTSRGLKFIFE